MADLNHSPSIAVYTGTAFTATKHIVQIQLFILFRYDSCKNIISTSFNGVWPPMHSQYTSTSKCVFALWVVIGTQAMARVIELNRRIDDIYRIAVTAFTVHRVWMFHSAYKMHRYIYIFCLCHCAILCVSLLYATHHKRYYQRIINSMTYWINRLLSKSLFGNINNFIWIVCANHSGAALLYHNRQSLIHDKSIFVEWIDDAASKYLCVIESEQIGCVWVACAMCKGRCKNIMEFISKARWYTMHGNILEKKWILNAK